MLLKQLLIELINCVITTACRKGQSAGHLPTSTTTTISPEINSMVIFRAKFSQGESQATHGRRVFLENLGMSLFIHGCSVECKKNSFPKILNLHCENVGAKRNYKQSATHQGGRRKRRRCYICPASVDCKTADMCKECSGPCCVDHK